MLIKLSSTAIRHLQEIIDKHLEYCGERSAMKFSHQVDEKLQILSKFPEYGSYERLLEDREIKYRSKLINKRYKMIYHIGCDAVMVDAFWDMRMHPKSLQKRV